MAGLIKEAGVAIIADGQTRGNIPSTEGPLLMQVDVEDNREFLISTMSNLLPRTFELAKLLFTNRWSLHKSPASCHWGLPLHPIVRYDRSIVTPAELWVPVSRDHMLCLDWGCFNESEELQEEEEEVRYPDRQAATTLQRAIFRHSDQLIVHPDDAPTWIDLFSSGHNPK